MPNNELILTNTCLTPRTAHLGRTLFFPHSLPGFQDLHTFVLLEVREDALLLVLQNVERPDLGLLVADPFFFSSGYSPRLSISDADRDLLQIKTSPDLKSSALAVLLPASIFPGKPLKITLNPLTPLLVNFSVHIGIQLPPWQVERKGCGCACRHLQREHLRAGAVFKAFQISDAPSGV